MKKLHPQASIRGNALWFILIAIFLLAALTMLITRTSTQTEETGESERATIAATQIMRYTSAVSSTVQKMLMRGISENQLSFGNTIYQQCNNTPLQSTTHNSRCTTNECQIFHVQGGGLTPFPIPAAALQTGTCSGWKFGSVALVMKRVDGLGNADNDEVLLEVYGVNKETCMQINRLLGIANTATDAPVDDVSGGVLYSGTMTTFGPQIGNEYIPFQGKKAFCLKSSNNMYSFFTVLIVK